MVDSDFENIRKYCATLFNRTPLEFRVMAACCRWPTDIGKEAVASVLEEHSVDWNSLLKLGERHRVMGFLAATLMSQSGTPESIKATLALRAQQIQRENLMQVALSVRVVKALEDHGIPCVVLKGAPLSSQVYGNIAVRQAKDIDLLIAPDKVELTERILPALGFASAPEHPDLSPRQAEHWARVRKHHEFLHQPTGCQLELHWKSYYNVHTDNGTFRRQHIECSPGISLPGLPPDELFLLLCAHGAGHAWFRLKWLLDIVAMQRQSSAAQRDDLLRLARLRGLARPVEQALLLSLALYPELQLALPQGLTLTGKWLARVGRDAIVTGQGDSEPASLPMSGRRAASRFLLRKGWRYRLEEARVLALWPANSRASEVAGESKVRGWLVSIPIIGRIATWIWQRYKQRARSQ